MSSLNEKCAVVGIHSKDIEVARATFFALFALQHRGQESAGIAVSDGSRIISHKAMGLVAQAFDEEGIAKLTGHISVGHNRYTTSKNSSVDYAQPATPSASLAFAHNGNLPSTTALVKFLKDKNISYEQHSDSFLMSYALQHYIDAGMTLEDSFVASAPLFTGAFSIVAMSGDTLIAARDPYGIRPLSIGKVAGGYIVASETCAFPPVNATFIRDVLPGEMVIIRGDSLESVQYAEGTMKLDMFEFIYFARHDSQLMGRSVYEVRKEFGRALARECGVDADVVIGVPETSLPIALGYAQESGIPYEMGLNKNRYIQRTFIQPDQKMRDKSVKMKLSPIPEVIKGKRVVVIDDSIVRGTTSKRIVDLLFEAGATEVHFRVSSPPIRYPDFYGIDTPQQSDLFAHGRTIEEMREFIGATSLCFLSVEAMLGATGLPHESFNTSCFTGVYPVDLRERADEFEHP